MARWAVTVPAIVAAMELASSVGVENPPKPPKVDLRRRLPVLTADVLAHTWDLAKSIGVDPNLDRTLCEVSYEIVQPNEARLRSSGMFGPAVPVSSDADAATRLIAFLGRDPGWTP